MCVIHHNNYNEANPLVVFEFQAVVVPEVHYMSSSVRLPPYAAAEYDCCPLFAHTRSTAYALKFA